MKSSSHRKIRKKYHARGSYEIKFILNLSIKAYIYIYSLDTFNAGECVARTNDRPSFPECTKVTGLTSFADDCTARANGLSLLDKLECTNVTLLSLAVDEWTTSATGLGSFPAFDCTAISGGRDWSEEFCTANVRGLDSLLPVVWVTKSCRVSPGITLSPGPICCKAGTMVARPWLVFNIWALIGRCSWCGCWTILAVDDVATFSWNKNANLV